MADKLNDIIGKFGKGKFPSGMGIGMKLVALAGAGAYAFSKSLYTVEGGQRAVMFNRIGGMQQDIYSEGIHLRVPWFQYPIIYDIRARPRKITSPTGTKDLQTVNISLRVLFRPSAGSLPMIHSNLGVDYDEKVLPSLINEVLKSVVAKFNAAQLITMRQEVSLLIRRDLTERANDFNLILDDVSITDLSFGREYTAAVEAKQVAQQEAQRASFVVEQARQERQQRIVYAEGESEAARKVGEALSKNGGYLKLRKLTAAKAISRSISNTANKVYLGADTLMLNLNSEKFDERINQLNTKR